MSNTTAVYARIDNELKENAEAVENYWKLMDDVRTEHITRLTKEENII